MKLRWWIETAPEEHIIEIPQEELNELASDEERATLIQSRIQDDFEQKVSWNYEEIT